MSVITKTENIHYPSLADGFEINVQSTNRNYYSTVSRLYSENNGHLFRVHYRCSRPISKITLWEITKGISYDVMSVSSRGSYNVENKYDHWKFNVCDYFTVDFTVGPEYREDDTLPQRHVAKIKSGQATVETTFCALDEGLINANFD